LFANRPTYAFLQIAIFINISYIFLNEDK
jgi:hypothetical protein